MRRLPAALTMVGVTLLAGCVVTTESRTTAPSSARSAQTPEDRTTGDGYAFLHTRDDGEPVRWSTCEPIRYVVRPANEPAGARSVLEASIDRVSKVTGLKFREDGTTDEAPTAKRRPYQPDRYGDRWAPVLIAYSTPEETSRLSGQAAGYGGPTYASRRDGTPRYVSGSVVLDVDQMTSMGGEDTVGAVMLHELSHLVGLAHVTDRTQLMNPVLYGRQVTDLQDGDLEGLRVLGDGDCYDPVAPRGFGRASG